MSLQIENSVVLLQEGCTEDPVISFLWQLALLAVIILVISAFAKSIKLHVAREA